MMHRKQHQISLKTTLCVFSRTDGDTGKRGCSLGRWAASTDERNQEEDETTARGKRKWGKDKVFKVAPVMSDELGACRGPVGAAVLWSACSAECFLPLVQHPPAGRSVATLPPLTWARNQSWGGLISCLESEMLGTQLGPGRPFMGRLEDI